MSRFSRTVSGAKTSSTWGTYPRPTRATSSGAQPVMSRSPTSTRPPDGLIIPARLFSSVLLPEPFGPMIAATWPGATRTDTPWMISPPPYPALISSASSSADKVGLHHFRPVPQRGHRPLGEHRAFRHHHHRFTELVHDGQFVFHHEDRHPPRGQGPAFVADAPGQPGMDAGHPLVQQQPLA